MTTSVTPLYLSSWGILVQHTDLPSAWAQALESLQLHKGQSQPPSGQSSPWYAPIMRFGKKGFLLAFLRPQPGTETSGIDLRLEMLLPASPLSLDDLLAQLASYEGLLKVSLLHEPQPNQPVLIGAHTSGTSSEQTARDLFLFLLKLGDHVVALDTNPNAPSSLAENGNATSDRKKAEPKQHLEEDHEAGSSASSSPFESIGASTPSPRASATASSPAPPAHSSSQSLRSFHLRAASPHHLELELELGDRGDDGHGLRQSIARNITTRFDAQVKTGRHNPNPVLELRPAITQPTQADIDRLYKDTHRYLERLIGLDEAGLPLDTILGVTTPRQAEASSFASNRDEMRRTRRDIPSSQYTAARASSTTKGPPTQPASEPNTGFVLAIDSAEQGSSPSDNDDSKTELVAHMRTTLKQGDFTDERLRREDATSALVDVVLRHPGYSDKNMAKVLTLLLSVDYSQALSIIALAPCMLAKGTGQERARTMKSVIEGAGGKVVLVEPDTFATT